MSPILIGGLSALLISAVYLLNIAHRSGERFEYAYAMFLGEFGLMVVLQQTIPEGPGQVVVTLVFGVSMGITILVWRKLFREYEQRPKD